MSLGCAGPMVGRPRVMIWLICSVNAVTFSEFDSAKFSISTRSAFRLYSSQAFEPERARQYVRRINFCFTPKHGSWLNIAENELSRMTRQCLNGRRIGGLSILQSEIEAWSNDVNNNQRGVDWQMKIDDARCKLKFVYPKIQC